MRLRFVSLRPGLALSPEERRSFPPRAEQECARHWRRALASAASQRASRVRGSERTILPLRGASPAGPRSGALRAGPSAGRQNKNKGAAPRRLHFDAGPGRRLLGAGDAAVTRRGRRAGPVRGRACLDAGAAAEPTRVRAVTGAGLASPRPEPWGPRWVSVGDSAGSGGDPCSIPRCGGGARSCRPVTPCVLPRRWRIWRPGRRWAARRCGCSSSWTCTWSWRGGSSPGRRGSASSNAPPRWGGTERGAEFLRAINNV